jgi:hypothetical protein
MILIAMIVQMQTGFVISVEEQAAMLAIINIVLRLVTKEAITLGGNGN